MQELTEKIITLDDEVSLIDFLGLDNNTIKEIASVFPTSKIISRGNQVFIKGNSQEIGQISGILESLLAHYQKYGRISKGYVKNFLEQGKEATTEVLDDDVLVHGPKGVMIRAKTANQKKMIEAYHSHDLVFAIGPAGTGKTYTAVALAVKALKEKRVKKIIITRPAVESGENLGFLPGDLKEKIDPYLRPIYDALEDMVQLEKLKFFIENRTIEIAPLAFMRGRTLNNAFILLDEAQNTTAMQMKMFLTRMGSTSKVFITGDKTQVDLPTKIKSGLVDAIEKLKHVEGVKVIELEGKDVLRHRLVRDILEAYDKSE